MSWASAEQLFLQNNFHTLTFVEIGLKLKKHPTTVYLMSRKLGLRKLTGRGCSNGSNKKRHWSLADDRELQRLYQNRSLENISTALDRSTHAISIRASKLGLRRHVAITIGHSRLKRGPAGWSAHEIETIHKLSKYFSIIEISKLINRSRNSVKAKMRHLNIESVTKSTNSWSERQQKFLEKNLPLMSIESISLSLGRSKKAIKHKIAQLGLHQATTESQSKWTSEQTANLVQLFPTALWLELIQATQHNRNQIQKKANRLGLQRVHPLDGGTRERPIGFEVQRGKCLYRKVATTGDKKQDWKRVDVIQWEEVNGPVPKGMTLIKKSLSQPRTLENLILVETSGIPIINYASQLTPEMRKVLALKGNIIRKINQLERRAVS